MGATLRKYCASGIYTPGSKEAWYSGLLTNHREPWLSKTNWHWKKALKENYVKQGMINSGKIKGLIGISVLKWN